MIVEIYVGVALVTGTAHITATYFKNDGISVADMARAIVVAVFWPFCFLFDIVYGLTMYLTTPIDHPQSFFHKKFRFSKADQIGNVVNPSVDGEQQQ